MLAADKLQLQSSLKQQATALKEKEFNLHHSNLMTVGTQAAVLAGLDMTMLVEFQPPPNSEWQPEMIGRSLKFLYYITITTAFCANLLVVANTTILSVLGAGMALRGPDGSMMTATDGLYEERKSVFNVFGIGLAATLASVLTCVWIILHWEAALCCMFITLITCKKVYDNYNRVVKRFDFDEGDTVDFRDIFESGAAQVRAYTRRDFMKLDKKGILNRKHRHKKDSSHDNHSRQRDNPYDNNPDFQYDNTSNSLTSDEELELIIPSNHNNNNYRQRSGMQQRRGFAGSSQESLDGGESSVSRQQYADNFIQTV